jgi:hypothetical protein
MIFLIGNSTISPFQRPTALLFAFSDSSNPNSTLSPSSLTVKAYLGGHR